MGGDINTYFNDEVICKFLEGNFIGDPLPSHVTSDVNPYQHQPSLLPEGIWYFIGSKVKKHADFGYWRTKGDAIQIFSSSSIIGWRSTLEFFKGQAPLGEKTNWVMQEYWITKILSKAINEREIGVLCNVFCVDEEKPLKMVAQTDTGGGQLTQSSVSVKLENDPGKGSTSNSQMGEVNVTGSNASVAGIVNPNNHADIAAEADYFLGGDFLELRDLDIPASPCSSSDSSCVTMSSDECFDALEFLRDLEPKKPDDAAQDAATGSGCKLRVFQSSTPTEMVMNPASCTGTLHKSPIEGVSDKVKKPDSGDKGTPSTSQSNQLVVSEGDGKAASGRKKKSKKKYLCFIPF